MVNILLKMPINVTATTASPSHQQRDAFLGRLHRLYGHQGFPQARGDKESCIACKKKLESLLRPYYTESFVITQDIKDAVIMYTGISRWNWGNEQRPQDFIHNVCKAMGPCNFPSQTYP